MLYEYWEQYSPIGGDLPFQMTVDDNAPEGDHVPVSIQINMGYTPGAGGYGSDWEMELQRYVDGEWVFIAGRSGYCHLDSYSDREFTGINEGLTRIVLHNTIPNQSYRRIESDNFYVIH
ncbi:hypothetical protein GLW04_19390 [Halobacillus litoralis]|uniref:Uncharacterized protein n=1 Tax=Halobacillus litoralis TaxID=45668 RepID=A0A845E0G0_9BACI|nr:MULTISPECIES: hypothetical protein [Halobacillus]MYL22042.1 hypothetical protein [Halobacillus litoralis]MYL31967.1 hypothetical protein [Halobacillus halophilus]MYL39967.1 hypothetical protein [Halobacillus litoralis]